MIEKRGVMPAEGQEPIAGGVTKAAAQDAVQKGCCGHTPCGNDLLSRMAEKTAEAKTETPACEKDI